MKILNKILFICIGTTFLFANNLQNEFQKIELGKQMPKGSSIQWKEFIEDKNLKQYTFENAVSTKKEKIIVDELKNKVTSKRYTEIIEGEIKDPFKNINGKIKEFSSKIKYKISNDSFSVIEISNKIESIEEANIIYNQTLKKAFSMEFNEIEIECYLNTNINNVENYKKITTFINKGIIKNKIFIFSEL